MSGALFLAASRSCGGVLCAQGIAMDLAGRLWNKQIDRLAPFLA